MSACPICSKPVDALRARFVGVRDGKVVAYCSEACRASAETSGPVRVPRAATVRTPPTGIPRAATSPGSLLDSGPVIEIITEPSGGTPKPDKSGATKADATKAAKADKSGATKADKSGPTKAAKADKSGATKAGVTSGDDTATTTSGTLAALAETAALAGDDSPSASGIRRVRRRKDSLEARAAWEWLDDEPAEVSPREDASERSGLRRALAILLLLAVLGGGGYLAYRYVYLPRTASPPATTPPPAKDAASTDAAPPTPAEQRRAALERAALVLRDHTRSTTVPLARAATAALARTGDAASVTALAAALESEPSETARLDLAYQLARAGDARGTDRLVATLNSQQNRELRLGAAERLARLADARAVPVLTQAMAYSQYRLSAAIELAALSEPAAIRALEQIHADPAVSAEDKARSAIALGRAGKGDINELRALLADKRNAEAAPVLAALGDPAAKPVLHEQLAFEHVRVEAARALRRYGNEGDFGDALRALLPALAAPSPTAQITAAESILLLSGPPAWASRR